MHDAADASAAAAAVSATLSDASRATQDAAKAFECGVCLRLLHQPATLPCGHSFCTACTISCLELSRSCPECRAEVPMNLPVPGCSISLQAALVRMFPAETAARAAEVVTPRLAESEGGVDELPLFVLDAMLPGQSMHLHVFEPRYLTLVRRALAQPSRQFGMVAPSANRSSTSHGLESRHSSPCASHGSLVVIDMVSELDGERLLLEVRATRRFKVLRPFRHEAGYVCARAEWVADNPPSGEDEAMSTRLTNLVLGRELRLAIDSWVEEVQRRGKERQVGQLQPNPSPNPSPNPHPNPHPNPNP
jgi:Lon protease-like protein